MASFSSPPHRPQSAGLKTCGAQSPSPEPACPPATGPPGAQERARCAGVGCSAPEERGVGVGCGAGPGAGGGASGSQPSRDESAELGAWSGAVNRSGGGPGRYGGCLGTGGGGGGGGTSSGSGTSTGTGRTRRLQVQALGSGARCVRARGGRGVRVRRRRGGSDLGGAGGDWDPVRPPPGPGAVPRLPRGPAGWGDPRAVTARRLGWQPVGRSRRGEQSKHNPRAGGGAPSPHPGREARARRPLIQVCVPAQGRVSPTPLSGRLSPGRPPSGLSGGFAGAT